MKLVVRDVREPVVKLLFLSDVHYGHVNCDVEALEKYLQMARKEDVRVLLGGDLFEAKLRKSKGRLSEQQFTPGEQLRFWKRVLEPIAGKIDAVVGGNHEERIAEETEIDVLREVSEYVGAEYDPVGVWLMYRYQRGKTASHTETVNVYVTHGASGAILPGGKVSAAYRLRWNVAADVILMGHVHQFTQTTGLFYDVTVSGTNRVLQARRQWVVTNGSCLRSEGSYGERKGYSFQPIVQTLVEIDFAHRKPEIRITAV